MPYNEISKTLFYNIRTIISADLPQPITWRVTKVESVTHKGNILFTFAQDQFDQNHDYIERDENERLIGMWANYYKDNNLPSESTIPSQPEYTDIRAEITYAGTEPHVKVNGSYKKLTITYYNATEQATDQTPGDWSYWIDGDTDATDLVKVLETDSANTIKIKFIGGEEYLGKVLTVKNIRNAIVATLQLQIVSL